MNLFLLVPHPAARKSPARPATRLAIAAAALGMSMLLCGCSEGLGGARAGSSATPLGHQITGYVHGGQQPISGATIQLYAVGNSGYGSASTPLISGTVTTSDGSGQMNSNANAGNANNTLPLGYFTITGMYTCPVSPQTDLVYIETNGGNPGLGSGVNPQISMMAALGSCTTLKNNPSTSVNIDELTTVASVWALSRFMSSYSAVGSSSTNVTGITNAFALVNTLVNTATGLSPGPQLPSGATLPVSELNTLADILAACINSAGGTANDGATNCGSLLGYATPPSGTAPNETIGAALDIALYPYNNVNSLCGLSSSTAPFQPVANCTTTTNWLVGINYTGGGLSAPNSVAVDSSGNVWLANSGANVISEFSNAGSPVSSTGYTAGGISGPSGLAIDLSGNVWVANKTGNSVSELSSAGAAVGSSPFTGDGVSSPTGVAIDGLGNVWLANSGNNSVSQFNSSGVLSGSYTPAAGLNGPLAIAINSH